MFWIRARHIRCCIYFMQLVSGGDLALHELGVFIMFGGSRGGQCSRGRSCMFVAVWAARVLHHCEDCSFVGGRSGMQRGSAMHVS